MKRRKKTDERKQVYISPDIQTLEIELSQNILAASGNGSTDNLQDFEWENW